MPTRAPAAAQTVNQAAFAQALAQAQATRSLPIASGVGSQAGALAQMMQQAGVQPGTLPANFQSALPGVAPAQAAPAPAPAPAAPAALDLPGGFGPIVAEAAKKYGVDPALIAAVMETESRFNPDAVSKAGARGLMQLMPATARGLGVTDASDPKQNVLGGAKLLGQLIDKYDGKLDLALAAYNAGSGAVDKFGGIPPYAETKKYVPLVLSAYERFRQPAGAQTPAPAR